MVRERFVVKRPDTDILDDDLVNFLEDEECSAVYGSFTLRDLYTAW
jgi:hypothetical protein